LNLTTVLITLTLVTLGYFAGIVRPTGLLSRRQGRWPQFPIYLVIGLFGVGALGSGGNMFWDRLQTEIEGKVVARQDIPKTPQNHGPIVVYAFERSDGARNEYTAPPGDGPLPQNLPIGAFLVKRKWELGYTLNGERVDDFPIIFSLIFMSIGLACLVAAMIMLLRGPRTSIRPADGGS
jgi:hypothetical protein